MSLAERGGEAGQGLTGSAGDLADVTEERVPEAGGRAMAVPAGVISERATRWVAASG